MLVQDSKRLFILVVFRLNHKDRLSPNIKEVKDSESRFCVLGGHVFSNRHLILFFIVHRMYIIICINPRCIDIPTERGARCTIVCSMLPGSMTYLFDCPASCCAAIVHGSPGNHIHHGSMLKLSKCRPSRPKSQSLGYEPMPYQLNHVIFVTYLPTTLITFYNQRNVGNLFF